MIRLKSKAPIMVEVTEDKETAVVSPSVWELLTKDLPGGAINVTAEGNNVNLTVVAPSSMRCPEDFEAFGQAIECMFLAACHAACAKKRVETFYKDFSQNNNCPSDKPYNEQ